MQRPGWCRPRTPANPRTGAVFEAVRGGEMAMLTQGFLVLDAQQPNRISHSCSSVSRCPISRRVGEKVERPQRRAEKSFNVNVVDYVENLS